MCSNKTVEKFKEIMMENPSSLNLDNDTFKLRFIVVESLTITGEPTIVPLCFAARCRCQLTGIAVDDDSVFVKQAEYAEVECE